MSGDNTEATREAGDPDFYATSSNDGGRSLWFTWTAPSDGVFTFSTASSDAARDTILVVFPNGQATTDKAIAGNDDIDFVGGDLRSRMGFTASAATTYLILLDGWNVPENGAGQLGTFQLTWAAGGSVSPPPDWGTPALPNVGVRGAVTKGAGTTIDFTVKARATIDIPSDSLEVTFVASSGLRILSVSGGSGAGCGAGVAMRTCWFAPASANSDSTIVVKTLPLAESQQTLQAVLTAPGDADASDDQVTISASSAVICDKVGTASADVLTGTSGSDVLCGLSGNDTLVGLGGNDLLFGGSGSDTTSYAKATAMSVDLGRLGAANVAAWPRSGSGGAGRDSLVSIENTIGSAYADSLKGNSASNTIRGGSGNDVIYGLGAVDSLFGDAGTDVLVGGTSTDRLNGGSGTDTCRESADRKVGCERS